MSNSQPLPPAEHRRDNKVTWLAANAAAFVVAAPFAVAYWASKGHHAVRDTRAAGRPSSGPFRDFRRLQYEREREAKLGVPASNEVHLLMRLDNERYSPGMRPSAAPSVAQGGPSRLATPTPVGAQMRYTAAPRGAQEIVLPRFHTTRVDLKVDFEEREAAKADGAKWDSAGHTWYAPAGTDLTKVAQFLPANVKVDPSAMEAAREAKTQAIVVPKEIAAARAAQAARQTELQLDPVADKDMAEDAVLVGAMSQDDSELPPVDAYDDVSGF